MTTPDARIETNREATASETARGWYLYGITQRAPLAPILAQAEHSVSESGGPPGDALALQLLEFSGLAAVVRPVLLADFSPTVLRERFQSASELEAMVRSHNRVIEAVHAHQPILPAKFGMVYPDARDILSGLRSARDTLLPQLLRLDGCDEWAVHLFAERTVVRDRIAAVDSTVARLRAEMATARPGRAYFLERQIYDAVEAATQPTLTTLAQSTFDRLTRCAIAGQLSTAAAGAGTGDEIEILRAAFLVRRDGTDQFEMAVRSCATVGEGLRCEHSGPWPPYSFASADQEAE